MCLKLSQLYTLWSHPNIATSSEAVTMNARYHPALTYIYAKASVHYQNKPNTKKHSVQWGNVRIATEYINGTIRDKQ